MTQPARTAPKNAKKDKLARALKANLRRRKKAANASGKRA